VLIGNNITSLENDSFVSKGLVELLIFRADRCKIIKIDVGAFNGLTNLRRLSLSSNEIREILPGTFGMISNLVYLYLGYNRIEHLGSDIFDGLVNLKFIDIQGNKLHYLHPDAFVSSPKLQHVYLSNNANISIPTDRHFINSRSLKELDISGCNISSVSVETFGNVSALERLSLAYNHLRTLNISILNLLPRLSSLYLIGNPLQCDCQLQEVWRWFQDHNIQMAYEEIVPLCDTPSEVKGLSWRVLETGDCFQGNMHYCGDYKNTRYGYTPNQDMENDTKLNFFTDPLVRLGENISRHYKRYPISVHVFPLIFGTTGNVIIIIIIICNKDMRTVPNMYILNLAISDIIYLAALFLDALTNRIGVTWLGDGIGCAFFAFCYGMSGGLTAYSVVVLSIQQQYTVTVNPFHVHVSSQPTWRGTGAVICGVWIVAALFAIPAVCYGDLCDNSELFVFINYYQHLNIFQMLVSCIYPLFVILFSYIMTARHLVESSHSISEETQNHQTNTQKNTAKTVLGLTVVFVISYVPCHITDNYLLSSLNYENRNAILSGEIGWFVVVFDTSVFVRCFLPLNSCLNPVALFCTSCAFRRHFKRCLTCCCKTKSPPNDF
jgi:hypothetical protein